MSPPRQRFAVVNFLQYLFREIRYPRTFSSIIAAVLVGMGIITNAAAQTASDTSCTPTNGLHFICGLPGPEDLVKVPETDWIIASSFAGLGKPKTFNGGVALLDPSHRTITKITPDPGDRALAPYDDCAAPPDPAHFSAHGLNIRREASGRSTLFVVGHGGREAIEVFDVAIVSGKPALTWIGCVLAPDGAFNNSVVGLPDGQILVTDFLHGSATFADLFADRNTGAVYSWTPSERWQKLAGTELSGPNGIAVSADRRYVFVADSGSATVFRYDMKATMEQPLAIDPGFRTDNIHWTPSGQLLLAGTKPDSSCQSGDQKCPETLFVKAFDPKSMTFNTLLEVEATAAFSNLSAALQVDHMLWLGSPDGNRIAYTQLP